MTTKEAPMTTENGYFDLPGWTRTVIHPDSATNDNHYISPNLAQGFGVAGLDEVKGHHDIQTPWYPLEGNPLYSFFTQWLFVYPKEGKFRVSVALLGSEGYFDGDGGIVVEQTVLDEHQATLLLSQAFGRPLDR